MKISRKFVSLHLIQPFWMLFSSLCWLMPQDVFKSRNMKVFKEIYKYVHNSIFCDAQLQLYLSPMSSSSARVSKQLNAALLYLRMYIWSCNWTFQLFISVYFSELVWVRIWLHEIETRFCFFCIACFECKQDYMII